MQSGSSSHGATIKDVAKRLQEQFQQMDIDKGLSSTDLGGNGRRPQVGEEARPEEQTPMRPEGSGRNVSGGGDVVGDMDIDEPSSVASNPQDAMPS
jgi:hypothetical protein